MNVPRKLLSVLVAGSLVALAACGGDDEPVLDPGTDETDSGATGSGDASTDDTADDMADDTSSGDDVDPAATIPEEFEAGSRPVEVTGDPLPAEPESGADAAIGMVAPVLSGEDYDGGSVRVDAVATGPTMLVFLAHWCSHCNAEIPVINELRDQGAFPDGLRIVAVSTGYRPDLPNYPPGEWLRQMGWTYPAMADELDMSDPNAPEFSAATAFGLTGFPYTVLIDADGTVAARWSGEKGDEIIDLIEAADLDL